MPVVYYNSDYARNKNKDSIIYKSQTGEVVEVTAFNYLKENPDKNLDDFLELKKYSDDDYHNTMLSDNKELRNTTPLENITENKLMDNKNNPQELMCSVQDKIAFYQNLSDFLKKSNVTATELRRFKMKHLKNLSYDEIASFENTSVSAICQSITNFRTKAKKFLK